MEQITFKASSIAEAIIGLLKEESRDKNHVEVFGCTDGTVVADFVEDYESLEPQYRAIWQNMRYSQLEGVESMTPQEAVERLDLEDLTFSIKTIKVFTD